MSTDQEHSEQQLKIEAEKALNDFKNGERQWSDFESELAFRQGDLENTFENRLDDVIHDKEGALELLSEIIDVDEDPEKTNRILAKQEFPSNESLKDWFWGLVEHDQIDVSVFAFVPLKFGPKIVGWTIIEQTGPGLDPDYEIVGIFHNKEEMKKYFWENFAS